MHPILQIFFLPLCRWFKSCRFRSRTRKSNLYDYWMSPGQEILNLLFSIRGQHSSFTPHYLRHQHRHHCRRCLRHFHHLSTALVEQGTPKWTFPINCFCCLSMNNLLREKKWKRTLVCTGVLDGVDALVLRVEFLGNKLTKSSTVLTNLSFCSYGNFIFALQLCP